MKQTASFLLGVLVSTTLLSWVVSTQAYVPVVEADPLEGWCLFAELDEVSDFNRVINRPEYAYIDITNTGVKVYERCDSI